VLDILLVTFDQVPTYAQTYTYILLILYLLLYVSILFVIFTFHINFNVNLSKISQFFSLHMQFSWVILFNILIGTPPFLIFFIKTFIFFNLILLKLYACVILLIFINFLLAYIYLQNFFFVKKSFNFQHITPVRMGLCSYSYQLWFIYINILGIFFFPLFFGGLYIFI